MKHLHKSGEEKPAASSPVRQKLIIASNNQGKIREFRKLLEPFGFDVVSMREAGFTDEIVEDGDTFEENAHIKARAVFEATKLPTIADDSGLEIDFLNGAPGIYSARYAGEGAHAGQRGGQGGSIQAAHCKLPVRYPAAYGGCQQAALG